MRCDYKLPSSIQTPAWHPQDGHQKMVSDIVGEAEVCAPPDRDLEPPITRQPIENRS